MNDRGYLGDYYNREGLRPFRDKVIEMNKRYKLHYMRAYQCFKAAKEVRCSGEAVFQTFATEGKVKKRAQGILSREIKKRKDKQGTERKCFFGGITCQGLISMQNLLQKQVKRIYELQESCGLAHMMLQELSEGIKKAGYDVVEGYSPEEPSRMEHLIVKELSLAFLTTKPHKPLEKRPYRRIRIESLVNKDLYRHHRAKLRFSRKIADGLIADGIVELQKAKELHDEMEALYNPFVHFEGVNQEANKLIAEIKSL